MINTMPRPRPQHLHKETTRHGVTVWYVRKGDEPRIRIRGVYGSPEFTAAYHAALSGKPASDPRKPVVPSASLQWLIEHYQTSAAWHGLALATRKHRVTTYNVVLASGGDAPYASITQAIIMAGIDRRADRPHAANNFLKAMRALFGWAAERGLVKVDPTLNVRKAKTKGDGFHTWTEEECSQFEERWPLGTRQRLAFDILLYTGLRRGNAVQLGRQHIKNGVITFRTTKTGVMLVVPLLQPLARSIEACPTQGLTFIETTHGVGRTEAGFGTWFRAACKAAGVPGSAHGLRKCGATRAALHGATDSQLRALFAWSATSKEPARYTAAANRETLARAASNMMLNEQDRNIHSRTQEQGAGMDGIKRNKINDAE